MTFADFILQHLSDDPATLALSRSRYADFPEFPLALSTLEARRKLSGKVPEWLSNPSLRFPYPLGAEQCSSSETAQYKSALVPNGRLADLTGGLGVDSWAFAKAGFNVLYNDMRPELVEAARHNFAELGLGNVRFSCAEIAPGCIGAVLGDFQADAFFLDPARRDSSGGKVFRIADCSPDVTALLPELFTKARFVLLKLSPMLDISQGAHDLGPNVKEIHVVGSDGECKELLFLLDREHKGDYTITVYDNGTTLSFSPADERDAVAITGESQGYLFSPGKALLKAGCFKLISQRFHLAKPGVNTHLYFAQEPVPELTPFGKWFRILEVAAMDKRGINAIGTKYPKADVTARGVPITSEALKKRLGVQSGSTGVHIFAAHDDTADKNLLIAATRE
ncbi:MAG: hypothetical protein J5769_03765 [Bacteroidales bacterium]|nr:hypothetical protein [Bacteroidales bacterium]